MNAIHTRTTSPQQLEWYKDVYRRHAGFIRHLTINLPVIFDACLEDAFTSPPSNSSAGQSLITRLESLTIKIPHDHLAVYFPELHDGDRGGRDGKLERPFIDACVKLVLANPGVRTLSLWCNFFPPIIEHIMLQLDVLPSLKNIIFQSLDARLPLLPPSVTSARVEYTYDPRNPFSEHLTPGPIHHGLEKLEISQVVGGSHIRSLLIQAPSLKFLQINSATVYYGPPGTEDHWPISKVSVLRLRQGKVLSESLYRCFPHLVEYHNDSWSSGIAAQLVTHFPFLEVIRISQDKRAAFQSPFPKKPRNLSGPFADCVLILLSSLPRLRVLDIEEEAIDANQVLATPWVCLDLEVFRCQIVGLPYVTEEEEQRVQEIREREARVAGGETTDTTQQPFRTDEEDQLTDRSTRCITTRRDIMAKLSTFASLKNLTLSIDLKIGQDLFEYKIGCGLVYQSKRDGRSYIRYDDVLPDTLHLRLDSGLDQLAQLRDLEYLGFESMDHRMGTAEIEWIAKQFPKLKEMRGLSMDKYVGIELDPKTNSLLALMRTLRPDVAHRQSFDGYVNTYSFISEFIW